MHVCAGRAPSARARASYALSCCFNLRARGASAIYAQRASKRIGEIACACKQASKLAQQQAHPAACPQQDARPPVCCCHSLAAPAGENHARARPNSSSAMRLAGALATLVVVALLPWPVKNAIGARPESGRLLARATTRSAAANEQKMAAQARVKRRIDRRQQSAANQTLPEFSTPIGNVTAVLGRDVRLVCTVDNLGPYQVAWLKEETKTILSIDTNIIITNYRIFLIPDEEQRKWVLHIKDVQESDRGFYQCQINTKPMRATSGYLEVVVPPNIIESQTSQVADALEHSNVSIQCKASGHPKPTVSWRRDDGTPIKLVGSPSSTAEEASSGGESLADRFATESKLNEVRSDKLTLINVDRSMGGQYVCTASNGILSQTSKVIPLYVKFAPKVSTSSRFVSVSLGDQLEIDCLIESFPKANSYWAKQASSPAPSSQPGSGRQRFLQLVGAPLFTVASGSALDAARAAWRPLERAGRTLERSPGAATAPGRAMRSSSPTAGLDLLEPQVERQVDTSELVDEGAPAASEFEEQPTGSETAQPKGDQMLPVQVVAAPKEPASGRVQTVSVKQTPINPYTYKLRLTVSQVSPADYGEYACHASNALGSSETRVIVTMADTRPEQQAGGGAQSLESGDFQRDGHWQGASRTPGEYVQTPARHLSAGGLQRTWPPPSSSSAAAAAAPSNRVYDENYLQAIKSRQQSGASLKPAGVTAGKLQQQKNRLRAIDSRNGRARTSQPNALTSLLTCCLALAFLLLL